MSPQYREEVLAAASEALGDYIGELAADLAQQLREGVPNMQRATFVEAWCKARPLVVVGVVKVLAELEARLMNAQCMGRG